MNFDCAPWHPRANGAWRANRVRERRTVGATTAASPFPVVRHCEFALCPLVCAPVVPFVPRHPSRPVPSVAMATRPPLCCWSGWADPVQRTNNPQRKGKDDGRLADRQTDRQTAAAQQAGARGREEGDTHRDRPTLSDSAATAALQAPPCALQRSHCGRRTQSVSPVHLRVKLLLLQSATSSNLTVMQIARVLH